MDKNIFMKVIKLVILVVKYFIKFKTLKAPNSRHKINFLILDQILTAIFGIDLKYLVIKSYLISRNQHHIIKNRD